MGCFRSSAPRLHDTDAGALDADLGPEDAGTPPIDAAADLGPDLGPDAGLEPLLPQVCFVGARLDLARSNVLRVSAEGLGCADAGCVVGDVSPPSDEARGVLPLRLEGCAEDVGPGSVECLVPEVARGDYLVSLPGLHAPLAVTRSSGPSRTPTLETTCLGPGSPGGLCPEVGERYPPDTICLAPGQPIQVRGGSSTACEPGHCVVRSTFLGGDHASLEVMPHQRSCDEAAPSWDGDTWLCPQPPAWPADWTWSVSVGGQFYGEFDASVAGTVCLDRPDE